MQVLFKRLTATKPDKNTWTEEENALSNFCEFIYKRRREILAEKREAAELEAAQNGNQQEGGSSTVEEASSINDNDTVMTSV
jgi:hypothetical protein